MPLKIIQVLIYSNVVLSAINFVFAIKTHSTHSAVAALFGLVAAAGLGLIAARGDGYDGDV